MYGKWVHTVVGGEWMHALIEKEILGGSFLLKKYYEWIMTALNHALKCELRLDHKIDKNICWQLVGNG